ncbi:hypothetical protein ACVJBD_003224 [Rhizobium mongolense]
MTRAFCQGSKNQRDADDSVIEDPLMVSINLSDIHFM